MNSKLFLLSLSIICLFSLCFSSSISSATTVKSTSTSTNTNTKTNSTNNTANNNQTANILAACATGSKAPVCYGLPLSTPDPSIKDYTLQQAIANYTQVCTYTFNGLAFITGNACADTFFPPGKVADFFGFQSMRDNAPGGMGHCDLFLDKASANVLYILNTTQRQWIVDLANNQSNQNLLYANGRFPLMDAFRRQLNGSIPVGTSGLSQAAVQNYSAWLYEVDANMSISRARLYAKVLNSLNATQKAYLDAMAKGNYFTWPNATAPTFNGSLFTKGSSAPVLISSFAGDILAWYAGNLSNYTYFCPERQGDYFGAFFVKDVPALLNHSYIIPTFVTGDGGLDFLLLLNTVQRQNFIDLVGNQYPYLMNLVALRAQIATELLKLRSGLDINETLIRTWDRQYGVDDGTISYLYATAYARVAATLNSTQLAKMVNLRATQNYPCPNGYGFVYGTNGTYPNVYNKYTGLNGLYPPVTNSDFLFA